MTNRERAGKIPPRQERRALHQLVAAEVLDPGWFVAGGTLRWTKARDLTIPDGFRHDVVSAKVLR